MKIAAYGSDRKGTMNEPAGTTINPKGHSDELQRLSNQPGRAQQSSFPPVTLLKNCADSFRMC